MTNEKKAADLIKSFFCLLVVLTISLYWGTPDSKASNQVPEEKASALTVSNEEIHNESESNASDSLKSESGASSQQESDIKVVTSDAPEKEVPDYICLNANRGGSASRKETDVLIRLINAEAYGLSYKAKVAVGQVVMNRWIGPYYGDDLLAIMTAPYQFTPIYDGSAYKKEVEPDSIKAAYAVLAGDGVKELTNDTYYFVNPDFTEDKTIEQKMQFVCEIENIHFYKPKAK